MSTLFLSPMRFSPREITEVVDLYASNPQYWRAAGEYDAGNIPADRVEADLRAEAAAEGAEILLARDPQGRLNGMLSLLDRHPVDGLPWIGLLMIHGDLHGRGVGGTLAGMAEQRFSHEGREGLRLAVLESNEPALRFWESRGWRECDRRPDTAHGRPCIVLHKALSA
ncbi:GNAT family N-acetyltransferase [Streptomyces sp. NPDC006475]|uniref:GNAT family N-acetyltransferase n=1 Tax=Streptomyces sp. NPDC006475 TaxID=3155719 RepID=UPI00339DF398